MNLLMVRSPFPVQNIQGESAVPTVKHWGGIVIKWSCINEKKGCESETWILPQTVVPIYWLIRWLPVHRSLAVQHYTDQKHSFNMSNVSLKKKKGGNCRSNMLPKGYQKWKFVGFFFSILYLSVPPVVPVFSKKFI